MPLPPYDETRLLLRPREPMLNRVVLNAWDRWWKNPERSQLYRRTRATLMHNYMMLESATVFAGDRGVRPIAGQETTYFLIEDRLLVRFKKGDEQGLSSNIDTQAALAYVDPQEKLLDLPDVSRLDVTYVVNTLQTLVDRVLIVARDGDQVAWSYQTYPSRDDKSLTPTPFPIQPKPPAPASDVVDLPADARVRDKENK